MLFLRLMHGLRPMMAIQTTLTMKHGGCYKIGNHRVAASCKYGNFVSMSDGLKDREGVSRDVLERRVAAHTRNPENIEILYREHDCKCVVMPRIAIQNDLLL